jgi:hypothetical protein
LGQERSCQLQPKRANPNSVFLNIPYDEEFKPLYLAYIVGLCQFGLIPRITAGVPGGKRRLSRILDLIQSCRYSIHDLSRVELSPYGLGTPRFNMPLELGMTITWSELNEEDHTWFVMESAPRRLDQSASDLSGTDANIHHGTVEGVLRELRNAFVQENAPTVPQMLETYGLVLRTIPIIVANAGTDNLYATSVFHEICIAAVKAARITWISEEL